MVIGSTLGGRFRIDKELGQGGMGAVYRAADLKLGRTVAIKVLKEVGGGGVGRTIGVEAQILARLLHDNIVRLYDFDEADGRFYLIMEEVDGTTLHRRWRQLSLGGRLRVLAQVADALDYAHQQGIIHRDVKPGNVLLTARDQAKLSDFGLSLRAGEATETTNTLGTPHYMSPEQARGRALDFRTDLYSLGVMLYECATGATPYRGTAMTVMGQHVHGLPDPPRLRNPDLPEGLERLILALMAREPADRPSGGREVARALRGLLAPGLDADREGGALAAPAVAAPAARDADATLVSAPASAPRPGRKAADRAAARRLVERLEETPVPLDADERYLCGHYLAYLLGGSRRQGFLLRRPLDPLNADRARLLLGMAGLMAAGGTDEALADAAALLEGRHDVRPALGPPVVMKYLACRDAPAKRKAFRRARTRLLEASPYARRHLVDRRGVLNPGLMPQVLADLRRVAPPRTEIDDQLVARWNRVAEVWRADRPFRQAVLSYATTGAAADPASDRLWPEVVYPLIERARWQRRLRSGGEAFWDAVSTNLFLPDPGVQLDRAMRVKVPEPVLVELDAALDAFVEDPVLPGDAAVSPADDGRASGVVAAPDDPGFAPMDVGDLGPAEDDLKEVVRLVAPDPIRLTHGELRELHRAAAQALRAPGSGADLRSVPIGPYRLVVVPSVRGRSAGQVAIQGLRHTKQIELLVPSFVGGSAATRPVVAAWVYRDSSLAIAHLDFRGQEQYVLWDAAAGHQLNFDDPAGLNSAAFRIGLEAPDALDRALSKRFRPRIEQ